MQPYLLSFTHLRDAHLVITLWLHVSLKEYLLQDHHFHVTRMSGIFLSSPIAQNTRPTRTVNPWRPDLEDYHDCHDWLPCCLVNDAKQFVATMVLSAKNCVFYIHELLKTSKQANTTGAWNWELMMMTKSCVLLHFFKNMLKELLSLGAIRPNCCWIITNLITQYLQKPLVDG